MMTPRQFGFRLDGRAALLTQVLRGVAGARLGPGNYVNQSLGERVDSRIYRTFKVDGQDAALANVRRASWRCTWLPDWPLSTVPPLIPKVEDNDSFDGTKWPPG
jgi:hypothetical protein